MNTAPLLLSVLSNTPGGAAPSVSNHIGPLLMLLRLLIGTGAIICILICIGHMLRRAVGPEPRFRQQAAPDHHQETGAERALVSPRLRGNRSISPAHWRAAGTGTDDSNLLMTIRSATRTSPSRPAAGSPALRRDLGLVSGIVSQQQRKEWADIIAAFRREFRHAGLSAEREPLALAHDRGQGDRGPVFHADTQRTAESAEHLH
ncbi:MAG TPA: hypothetical protein VFN42_11255 [Acetobacteraceae bacterium]|nr:hypothetical protein [Acetobacteraceae bacterium]